VYKSEHREYTLRLADAGNGDRYTIAVLRQIEQGNGEAQDAARDLLHDLTQAATSGAIRVIGIVSTLT
jgi:hypothetical protein